jgi:acyl transferase domain-containing protein/phosphopantetheinyl transferase
MVNEKDVALVGMSCVFPLAANLEQYWSNLVNGVDAIGRPPTGRWAGYSNFRRPPDDEAFLASDRGGYLDPGLTFDPVAYGIQPNQVRHGDPDQFFALHLIDQALRDARIADDSPLRARTDVLLGHGRFPTGKQGEWSLRTEYFEAVLELLERHSPGLLGGRRQELETYLRSALTPPELDNVSTGISTLVACRAANRLNLRGTACIVDTACSSSLVAVEQAMWRLRNGRCDLAVAGGAFVSLTTHILYLFTRLGALSRSGVVRPFDRRADGLLPGEGGGVVVLKRLADAIRDGDQVYAILRGAASASDGREVDVLAPSSAGQIAALDEAYADAGVDRDTVGYLELHGTGTVAGDAVEIATVKGFFGTVKEPATARAMGSVKSMIGHTMSAAGIAGLIKAALSLSNKVLCPTLHCEEPRPELADAPFYLNTRTRPWVHDPARGPRRAGVSAMGFGGINAHVILEEVTQKTTVRIASESFGPPALARRSGVLPRPVVPSLLRPSELAVFSAGSVDELTAKLDRLERFLDQDGTAAKLADIAWSLTSELDLDQSVKLALVCTDVEHLRQLLRTWRASREASVSQGVYFSAAASSPKGKIAFLFPGMGFPGLIGAYPDRLIKLCLHFPEVREEFDSFESRDGDPEDTVPTSAIFAPRDGLPVEYRRRLKSRLQPEQSGESGGDGLSRRRNLGVLGVTLSNWVSWRLLRKFQIPVDMLVGESMGDIPALCAAGGADFHRLAPAIWKSLRIEGRDVNDGLLAFAAVSAEQVEPILDQTGTHIAAYQTPGCVIFGGTRAGVQQALEELRRRDVFVYPLQYPPIHTPTLSHLCDEVRQGLASEQVLIRGTIVPLYSSITAARYPDDPQEILETLLMNIDHPLRLLETAERLYQDGARIFVQVGGSHSAAIPQADGVTAAALDAEGQNPLTQLNHLLATLLCAGVHLQLEPLYEHRHVRNLDLDRSQPAPAPSRTAVPLRLTWSPLMSAPRRPEEPVAADPQPRVALPVLGQVTHLVPQQELVLLRTLDLAEDLYLSDHLFVHAPHKQASDCLPVLPLTMSMEFAAETAALLCPGLGLIGFEKVRGKRWIALAGTSSVELRIEARVQTLDPQTGVRRVDVSFLSEENVSFTATVLFAEDYRQDLRLDIEQPAIGKAWPITAEQVYSERYLFHGPAFHCLVELGAVSNSTASGVLAALPTGRLFASNPEPFLLTDPCVLDAAGQLVGLLAQLNRNLILPHGVEKIEFYCPRPAAGTRIPIRLQVVEFDAEAHLLRTNLELEDGSGGVWARVLGWTVHVWECSDRYLLFNRLPHRHPWAEELELPGAPEGSVCAALTTDDLKGVILSGEREARLFLHEAELAEFRTMTEPGRRREFLASRVAAKDAVRLWWARHYSMDDLPHPSLFCITHDDWGRPYLALGEGPELPYLSLAHTAIGAVAIAADVPVGIDMELASRDTRSILSDFADGGEVELVERLAEACPEDCPSTRLWCAKEAMAKAMGTGLQSRTEDLEAVAEEGGSFRMRHRLTGERMVVHTAQVGPFVVALTSAFDQEALSAARASGS